MQTHGVRVLRTREEIDIAIARAARYERRLRDRLRGQLHHYSNLREHSAPIDGQAVLQEYGVDG